MNDAVLFSDDKIPRGHWPLGRIIDVNISDDGHARRFKIQTKKGVIERPYSKLVLITEMNPENLI